MNTAKLLNGLWDLFCVTSVVGIWPRYIEPNLLSTRKITLPIRHLPKALDGFSIVQFSDLHLDQTVPEYFLQKLTKRINAIKPDLIAFTGDFISYSTLNEPVRLKQLLQQLRAPYGSYAIFGNHDYSDYVGINEQGDYDLIERGPTEIGKGFRRLLRPPRLSKKHSSNLSNLTPHSELVTLLQDTPFVLLENATTQIAVKDSFLNIVGLGEYFAGRCQPEVAFKNYDRAYPGIILAHNPDAAPLLESYPGDVILSGHVHGGQINLPGIVTRFCVMEYPEFKRGLFRLGDKLLYVNRGIGGSLRFRWFAVPEITHITLQRAT